MRGTQFLLAALFIISVLGVIGFGLLPKSLEIGANGAALAFGILASTCIAFYVIIDIVLYKEAKKIG